MPNLRSIIVFSLLLIVSFYKPLFAETKKLKLSGEFRTRGEIRQYGVKDNKGKLNIEQEESLFTRLRMSAYWRLHNNLGARLVLQDARALDSSPHLFINEGISYEENYLDIYQAYLRTSFNLFDMSSRLYLGRQVLGFGSERLIGGDNWRNSGRNFDALKLQMKGEEWEHYFFLARPVISRETHFDDASAPFTQKDNDLLWGWYSTWNFKANQLWDFYLLQKQNSEAGDDFYTLGIRAWGKLKHWDYGGEWICQTGNKTHKDFRAYAMHLGGGYWPEWGWKPRFGGEYNFATGDPNPNDDTIETFDNLYPSNHIKYGFMDLIGLANIHDFMLSLSIRPEWFKLVLEQHYFYREEKNDFNYDAVGRRLVLPRQNSNTSFLGRETDLRLALKVPDPWSVEMGYAYFSPGKVGKLTNIEKDRFHWGYIEVIYKF